MMGQLLNLNCAILLMPVTHKLVVFCQDATSIKGYPWMRWVSFFIPWDKAVVFHKACAKYFILPFVMMVSYTISTMAALHTTMRYLVTERTRRRHERRLGV